MITVAILINGQPIMARSAVNEGESPKKPGHHLYRCDDGTVIEHKRDWGAVPLAIQLLDTIKWNSHAAKSLDQKALESK